MKSLKTRAELIELISELLTVKGEEEQDAIYEVISNSVVDPLWSGYLFHSDESVNDDEEINIEGLVDKILSYKPIIL